MKKDNVTAADTYYRYQADNQLVIRRTSEQSKIVREYFIIPNVISNVSHAWLKILGILLIVLGALAAAFCYLKLENILFAVCCLALSVVGIVLLVVFSKTKKTLERPEYVMSSQQYESAVKDKISQMDVQQMSLNRLGISAETAKETMPLVFCDVVQSNTALYVYETESKTLHSSAQQVTYLYFMSDRLLAYQLQFDMCCDALSEHTSEMFYKDICDVCYDVTSGVQMCNDVKIEHKSLVCTLSTANTKFAFGIREGDDAATEHLRLNLIAKRRG